jgi:predicted DNA-binding protein with PD1-like motif
MQEPVISERSAEVPAHETPRPAFIASPTEFRVLRLGTGEDFTSRLLEEFTATRAPGGSIVTAVGSFSEVTYGEGFYDPDGNLDMREVTRNGDPFETGALTGHLGYNVAGDATAHVHALFATPDGSLFGGHIFGGKILLTLELTIALHSSAGWTMQPHDPEPHVPMSILRRAFLPSAAQTEKEACP